MTTFAFVFARGGSKGLPGKNVKPLHGKPLIAYSIEVALATPGVDAVYVSTDDEEIATVAAAHGANVPFMRPAELGADTSPEFLAWQHAVREVSAIRPFDRFLSLPCTAPLRAIEDVENALAALDDDVDVVTTMTEAHRNPWFNMVVRDADNRIEVVNSGAGFARRQDAPEVFDLATVAYVARPQWILEHDALFDGRVRGVLVPRERALDIDTPFDFRLAEILLEDSVGRQTR